MERQLIPESVQNRAKSVAKELNEQLRRVEGALGVEQLQEQLKRVTDREWLAEQIRLNDLKSRISDGAEELKTKRDAWKTKSSEWLTEQISLDELKTRISSNADELKSKSSDWLDETYASVMDRLGIATKTEVEVLRRKLSSLQRRVRELKQTLKAN